MRREIVYDVFSFHFFFVFHSTSLQQRTAGQKSRTSDEKLSGTWIPVRGVF